MALKHACIPNPGNRASFDLLSKSLTQPPTIHTPQGSPTRSNALTLTPTSKTVGTIRGSPFSKSSASKKGPKKFSDNIWDPDDDEFPDWPGTYKSTYGSFKSGSAKLSDLDSLPKGSGHERGHRLYSHPREGDLKTDDDSGGEIDTDARDAGPTRAELEIREQERIRDTIAELSDPACGKTSRADMHDELMVQHKFFRSQYEALPADLPAAHMHLVIWESFANLRRHDRIVQYVRPRLCDAVATVLFETSPKCLDDFLDGNVRVFEWRHEFSQSSRHLCLIVRREDNIVMCGLYRNHGFHYLWQSLLRSRIHFSGKWSEYLAACHGTTAVTDRGPDWGEFSSLDSKPHASPDMMNPLYALFVGRQLACYLVGEDRRPWEYGAEWGEKLEWEADGTVTDLTVKGRSTLSGTGEGAVEE